jgi:hypothetical protein
MYSLPTSVEINGASFGIREKGDFRMVLDCFNALHDTDLTEQERLYSALIIFYEDFDIDKVLNIENINEFSKKMFWFFNQGEDDLQSNTQNIQVIDWNQDSNLICSAINTVARQEIRALPYLHWWTFMGYYMAIGECALSTIVSIRYKQAKGKKLEKYEKQYINDNPQYFNRDYRTQEQKDADEYVRKLWGE